VVPARLGVQQQKPAGETPIYARRLEKYGIARRGHPRLRRGRQPPHAEATRRAYALQRVDSEARRMTAWPTSAAARTVWTQAAHWPMSRSTSPLVDDAMSDAYAAAPDLRWWRAQGWGEAWRELHHQHNEPWLQG